MSKTERKIGQQIRREAREDIARIHHNIVSKRPWYLPRFLWRKIVAIVLTTNS